MAKITDKDTIISFLRNIGGDHENRTLSDHWAIDNVEMERCHDRIQWLFPLHEDSHRAKNFPVITPEIVEEAKKYPEIEKNMVESTRFFLKFLGVIDKGLSDLITEKQIFYPIRGNWCRNADHNLLRITRMFRSLRLFGLDELAKELYPHFLRIGVRAGLSSKPLEYWQKAVSDPVWDSLR